MASLSTPSPSSAHNSTIASASSSPSISQRASSQASVSSGTTSTISSSPFSSSSPSSNFPSSSSVRQSTSTSLSSSSSKFPSSSSVRQSMSISSSSASFPLSTLISPSSSSQAPSHPSTNLKITTASHQTTIIAATTASIAALVLLLGLGLFVYCRRRSRRNQLEVVTSQRRFFLPENSTDYSDKDWQDTARSTAGSGWPSESEPTSPAHHTFPIPLPVDRLQLRQSAQLSYPSAKAPHYTVRSHASMTDVYGFGQDLAWQEAHYEDPLPIGGPAHSADISIIPPTPPSDITHHDTSTASATSLLRSHSTASSVSSQYSTASMPGRLPDIDISVPPTPPPTVIHDALATDDRDWINCTRGSEAPPHRQSAQGLV